MLHLPWQTIALPIKWLGVLNLSSSIKGKIGESQEQVCRSVCSAQGNHPGKEMTWSFLCLVTQTGTPYHPRCPLGQPNQMPHERSPFWALRLGPSTEILTFSLFKGGQHHSCSWMASTRPGVKPRAVCFQNTSRHYTSPRSFFCQFISLKRSSERRKKSLILLPCSSLSVV